MIASRRSPDVDFRTVARVRPVAAALLVALGSAVGAASQVFRAPQGTAENLRFEQAAGGVITITYDLRSDDPQAVYTIVLEVTGPNGVAITPSSVNGDTGPGVRPGTDKRIVWAASRDVEVLQVSEFKFNIRASAGAGVPVDRPAPATPVGRLAVTSAPPGATVFVDGVSRGVTPVTLTDLSVGSHTVRLVRDGYLENQRPVSVGAGTEAVVDVRLTAAVPADEGAKTVAPPPAGGQPAAQPMTQVGGGGGGRKWLWIGLAGAGAAGAGVALGGGGGGGGTTTPPPVAQTAEICGNGIDDNGNGQIDESPPCPVRQEICGNGIDDDGDGLIDESPCPPVIPCTFSISPTTVPQFAAAGGTSSVTVTVGPAGCSPSTWTTSNASASWISISPGSGTGSGSATLTAAANTSTTSRSGSVTVASQTASVSQGGADSPPPPIICTFRASFAGAGTSTSVPGDSVNARRDINVDVSTSTCQWSVSGTPSWFRVVTGATTQTGNGSVVMASTEVNTTGRDRSANFQVAGVNFTVTQCAARCP